MTFEGGFQGRTNKLVDGCYSFWCGAIMPIVQAIISKKGKLFCINSYILSYSKYVCCNIQNGIFRTAFESYT